MIRVLRNLKFSIIKNVAETKCYQVQSSQKIQRFHTSNSEYHPGIPSKHSILTFYLQTTELSHGEYEWQDPKSEDEV